MEAFGRALTEKMKNLVGAAALGDSASASGVASSTSSSSAPSTPLPTGEASGGSSSASSSPSSSSSSASSTSTLSLASGGAGPSSSSSSSPSSSSAPHTNHTGNATELSESAATSLIRTATALVQQRLFMQQNPVSCRNVTILYSADDPDPNFSTMLWHHRLCLTRALRHNMVYVARFRQEMSWFKPWSSCTDEDVELAKRENRLKPCYYWSPIRSPQLLEEYSRVPKEFEAQGRLWWQSQAVSYLLRPRPSYLQWLNRRKRELNWPANEPVIGLHIPRDHSKDEAVRYTLKQYMDAVDSLHNDLAVKTLFVMTDSPAALRKETKAYPAYRFIFGGGNFTNHTVSEWQDLDLLAHTSAFVFTYASAYAQMALHLKLVYDDFCSTYIALDNIHGQYPNHKLFMPDRRVYVLGQKDKKACSSIADVSVMPTTDPALRKPTQARLLCNADYQAPARCLHLADLHVPGGLAEASSSSSSTSSSSASSPSRPAPNV